MTSLSTFLITYSQVSHTVFLISGVQDYPTLEAHLWRNYWFLLPFESSISLHTSMFSFFLNPVISFYKNMQTFLWCIRYHVIQGFIFHRSLDPPRSCSAKTLLTLIVPSVLAIRTSNKPGLHLELMLTWWKSIRREKSIDLKLANHWNDPSSSAITLLALWHGRALFTPAGLSMSLLILRPVWDVLQSMRTGPSSTRTFRYSMENECKQILT